MVTGAGGQRYAANIVNASGPKNPVHKLNEVPSTDPVVLRGVKREAANSAESAAAEKSAAPGASSTENAATADDTQKKVAEIASLEKQIQDKMKRIMLLMRLFVKDEKPFIVDPANPREMRQRKNSGSMSKMNCCGRHRGKVRKAVASWELVVCSRCYYVAPRLSWQIPQRSLSAVAEERRCHTARRHGPVLPFREQSR